MHYPLTTVGHFAHLADFSISGATSIPSHLVHKIDDILVYRIRERSSAKTYTRDCCLGEIERTFREPLKPASARGASCSLRKRGRERGRERERERYFFVLSPRPSPSQFSPLVLRFRGRLPRPSDRPPVRPYSARGCGAMQFPPCSSEKHVTVFFPTPQFPSPASLLHKMPHKHDHHNDYYLTWPSSTVCFIMT